MMELRRPRRGFSEEERSESTPRGTVSRSKMQAWNSEASKPGGVLVAASASEWNCAWVKPAPLAGARSHHFLRLRHFFHDGRKALLSGCSDIRRIAAAL